MSENDRCFPVDWAGKKAYCNSKKMEKAGLRGGNVKKLLLTEGLIACFFLTLLLGIFGKYLSEGKKELQENAVKEETETREEGTIWIYPGSTGESFSPLCCQSAGEANVLDLCFCNVLSRDAAGKRDNPEVLEKWKKDEAMLAHISEKYDEKKKLSEITIQLNPEIKTVSGVAVTADDLLFNYYLRCDISSGGKEAFGDVKILGQEKYFYGSEDVTKRKKEIQEILKKPSKEIQKLLQEKIVKPALSQELVWVKELYSDEAYDFISSKYKEPKDLFAYYYAYQTKYSPKGKTEKQVLEEIAGQYGWHYEWLSKVTDKNYEKEAERIALSVLLQQEGKDSVRDISGIAKKDERTVVVLAEGEKGCADKLCDFWLLPLAEYGDRESFDGKTHFGFQKGKTEDVLQKTLGRYCATGPYYAKKVGKGKITLKRNPYYFGKKAEIREICILRKEYTENKEIVKDLLKQNADIILAEENSELNQLLKSRGTHASYKIRKKAIETQQLEDCLLYRTSYVNAPSLPEHMTQYDTIFKQITNLKVNAP